MFSLLSPMQVMAEQHDTNHDVLHQECAVLWTNPDVVLKQLQEYFEDVKKFFVRHFHGKASSLNTNLKGTLLLQSNEVSSIHDFSYRMPMRRASAT